MREALDGAQRPDRLDDPERPGAGEEAVDAGERAAANTRSLNGGPFTAKQSVTLKRGATLTVIDDDVMLHQLVKLAGSSVTMRNGTTMPMMGGYISHTPGRMNPIGAWTAVSFGKAGTYRFRTRAGEDYMAGVQTSGADNVLGLTVTVR